MGRVHLPLAVLALAAVALFGSVGAGAATSHSNLLVTESEYHVQLSSNPVRHGLVTITVVNNGQDVHNLYVGKPGHLYHATRRISSGGRVKFSVTLPRGGYNLYCGLPGHRALGMLAHLKVD